MNIQIQNGLPILTISLAYNGKTIRLEDVRLDTGCSNTIFDTDEVEELGLLIDSKNGRPRRMYGVDFMLKSGLIIDFNEMKTFRL